MIEDHFEGQDEFKLESRFNLAPDIDLQKKGKTFKYNLMGNFGDGQFKLADAASKMTTSVLHGSYGEIGGWYFSEYGKKEKASTITFKGSKVTPLKMQYSFSWSK